MSWHKWTTWCLYIWTFNSALWLWMGYLSEMPLAILTGIGCGIVAYYYWNQLDTWEGWDDDTG